ncbi:FlgD immunoglobulin-like domain containing protein [Tessaracoccus caeni]|uniref:FlgD immunoglobulin-like domain containing protein n=1 Tax=Tessaracoccus caeni TaxID=3031239 RepID=UPI0023DC1E15|nr:FlgD immunoglobulin-like domain containing protein [Tessaracoccus caeni]MDF1489570.1 FlgD immunoglobulin-like domain containing protein [Tessaracoccus caeni]
MPKLNRSRRAVSDISGTKLRVRRPIAMVAGAALVLGGSVSPALAEARPTATVDITVPTKSLVGGGLYKLSTGGVALHAYDLDGYQGWRVTSDGKTWRTPDLPGWADEWDSRPVTGVDGVDYITGVAYEDGQDYARRVPIAGGKDVRVSLPMLAMGDQIAVLPDGAVFAAEEAPELRFRPFDGVEQVIADIADVSALVVASPCHAIVTGYDAGAKRKLGIYDTCARKYISLPSPPSATSFHVDKALVLDDEVHIGDSETHCAVPLVGGKWVCREFDGGVPTLLGWLTYDNRLIDTDTGKELWSFDAGSCEAGLMGVVCDSAEGSIFLPTKAGAGKKFAERPREPVPGSPVGFSGDALVLSTRGALFRATLAADGKSASPPEFLAQPGEVAVSAARVWVGDRLYDRGQPVSEGPTIPACENVRLVSGPFVLSSGKCSGKYVTTVRNVSGDELWSQKSEHYSEAGQGLFGSRLLAAKEDKGGKRTSLYVVDFESDKQLGSLGTDADVLGFWGDEAYLLKRMGDEDHPKTVLQKWLVLTGEVEQLAEFADELYGYGGNDQVSDGTAVIPGYPATVIDTSTGRIIALEGGSAPRLVYNNRVAGFVATPGGSKVRVHTLDVGGKSAPRLLGTVAPSSFAQGTTWAPEFDLTKPLKAGKLVFKDAKGKAVRSVPLPASGDGSYRGVGWDGKTDAGADAALGTYTWEIQATDDPGRTGLKAGQLAKALDGKGSASGTVKLTSRGLEGPTPKVSGTVQVGKKLTAKPGTWRPSDVKFSYQWYRDGKKISKATKSTYTLTSSDKGTKITVKVIGKKSGYTTVSKMSKKTALVKAGTLSTKTPTISGTVKVGKKLTAKPGTWSPKPKFSYRWLRNGKSIKGATKSTYTLSKSDKGMKITVKVTGKKSGYTTVTKTSKPTAKIKK